MLFFHLLCPPKAPGSSVKSMVISVSSLIWFDLSFCRHWRLKLTFLAGLGENTQGARFWLSSANVSPQKLELPAQKWFYTKVKYLYLMKNTRNCLYFWCKHAGPVFENRINSEKCVKNKTTFTLTTFKVVRVKVILVFRFSRF